MHDIFFGQSQHEYIAVDVLRYERSPVGDYHDDNWLAVEISVQVGAFRGKINAAFLTEELTNFLQSVKSLYKTLKGEATFSTLEGQLKLKLVGDGKGHIKITGEIFDQPGIGNRLNFILKIDQTVLWNSISELEEVVAAFPVRTT